MECVPAGWNKRILPKPNHSELNSNYLPAATIHSKSPGDGKPWEALSGVTHLCGQAQHLLHQLLCLRGLLQEQLHNGSQQLQLDLWGTDRQTSHTGFVQEHMDLTPASLSRDQRLGDNVSGSDMSGPLSSPFPHPHAQVDPSAMGQDLQSRLHGPTEHPFTSTWMSSRNSPVRVPPNLSGSLDLWLCYLAFVDSALLPVTRLQGVLHIFPEMETLQNSTANPLASVALGDRAGTAPSACFPAPKGSCAGTAG